MKSLALVLVFAFALLAAPSTKALHIMLDPGHGGVDQGAVHGRLKEAEVVLDVAKRLERLLAREAGIRVSMTRTENRGLALPQRTRLAETAKADLLVSLHANSAPDPRAQGVELFFQNSLAPDEDALYLANLENQNHEELEDRDETDSGRRGDVSAIVQDLKRQNRLLSSLRLSTILSEQWLPPGSRRPAGVSATIKQAPLYVVSRSSMPSVLVELGFLTHPMEARKLASTEYRQALAVKLKEALVQYKEKISARTIQNETISK